MRILRICPWYKELEPVLRDRPMARAIGTQDTLANNDLDITLFTPTQPSQESLDIHNEEVIEGWFPTPPKNNHATEDGHALDPSLRLMRASPSDSSFEGQTQSHPTRRSPTPSSSQSPRKRQRAIKKKPSLAFDSPESSTPCDALGLKSLLSQMPTKEERAESQKQVVLAHERMTQSITEAMTNIITNNRAMDITAQKETAALEMQYKNRVARGNLVVELICAGQSPEQARTIAREEFPDI